MNDHDCFLCLNKCKNRICGTCHCYGHLRCYGEYLKHKTCTYLYMLENDAYFACDYSVPCPQCRSAIINLKPVTRSDTYIVRHIIFCSTMENFMIAITNEENKREQMKLFKLINNTIKNNRQLLFKDTVLKKNVKKQLKNINTFYDLKLGSYIIL